MTDRQVGSQACNWAGNQAQAGRQAGRQASRPLLMLGGVQGNGAQS